MLLFGRNEFPMKLFFFFSLSSRDVNSSSELLESSSLEGIEKVRLGEITNVLAPFEGRHKGDRAGGEGSDGKVSSSLHRGGVFSLVFGSDLGLV